MLSSAVRVAKRGPLARSKPQTSSKLPSSYSRILTSHSSIYTSFKLSSGYNMLFNHQNAMQHDMKRFYAKVAAQTKSSPTPSSQESSHWQSLRYMIEKSDKASKADIRSALKHLKEQEASVVAEVLKSLSTPLPQASTALSVSKNVSTEGYRESKMGPVLEESIARMLEVTFEPSRLGPILSRLSVIYPQWRADGWDNVIERLIANKNYHSEYLASVLVSLPRDILCGYQIPTNSNDMIYNYEKNWLQSISTESNHHLGTYQSSKWSAAHYGRLLGQFAKKKNALTESASITAYLAFDIWSRSTPLGSSHPYEAFVSSVYFAGEILANIVPTVGDLKNHEIAAFLQTFNLKLLAHLKSHPDLVKEGFNTFEYLEWVAIVVAETGKLRGSKFNDLFMIKKSLDAMLENWGSDDVSLVSDSISRRFTVSQFLTEALEERKVKKSS